MQSGGRAQELFGAERDRDHQAVRRIDAANHKPGTAATPLAAKGPRTRQKTPGNAGIRTEASTRKKITPHSGPPGEDVVKKLFAITAPENAGASLEKELPHDLAGLSGGQGACDSARQLQDAIADAARVFVGRTAFV